MLLWEWIIPFRKQSLKLEICVYYSNTDIEPFWFSYSSLLKPVFFMNSLILSLNHKKLVWNFRFNLIIKTFSKWYYIHHRCEHSFLPDLFCYFEITFDCLLFRNVQTTITGVELSKIRYLKADSISKYQKALKSTKFLWASHNIQREVWN